ncbi:MAG: hypothetical protein SFU91_09050 [Chloroherpetonaceae bacterium]|nr:hypothetical protein [Chloroherpetonaceae bacterium]
MIKLSGIAISIQEELTKNTVAWKIERDTLRKELEELKVKFAGLREDYFQLEISTNQKVKVLEEQLSINEHLLSDTSDELEKKSNFLKSAEILNSDLNATIDSLKKEINQKTIEYSRLLNATEEELNNTKVELKIAINDLGKALQEKHFLETQYQKTRETSDFLSQKLSEKESLFIGNELALKEKILKLEKEISSFKSVKDQETEIILSLQNEILQIRNRENSLESERMFLIEQNEKLLRKLESGCFLSLDEKLTLQNQLRMILATIEDELEES